MNEKPINNYALNIGFSGLTYYIQYADYGDSLCYYAYFNKENIPSNSQYTVAIFKVKCKEQPLPF